MDPWDPYSFYGMGSAGDPFNYYAGADYSTQFGPTAQSPYGDEMVGSRDPYARPTPRSQVPGTAGEPEYTPSVNGDVASGSPGGVPDRYGPAIADATPGSMLTSRGGIYSGLGGMFGGLG